MIKSNLSTVEKINLFGNSQIEAIIRISEEIEETDPDTGDVVKKIVYPHDHHFLLDATQTQKFIHNTKFYEKTVKSELAKGMAIRKELMQKALKEEVNQGNIDVSTTAQDIHILSTLPFYKRLLARVSKRYTKYVLTRSYAK